MHVLLDGAASTQNSLGIVTQRFARYFNARGVKAYVSNYDKGDPEFWKHRHFLDQGLQKSTDFIDSMYYINTGMGKHMDFAMHATKSAVLIPYDDFRWTLPHIRKMLSRIDKVITFSRASQEFLSHKLNRIVEYCPLGIDIPDTTGPVPLPKVSPYFTNLNIPLSATKDLYTFLTVGYMQDRKGITGLLQAYFRGFYNNPKVLLWIHGRAEHWGNTAKYRKYLEPFRSDPDAPLIIWTDNALTEGEMSALFRNASCYVSPHHMEGFGFGPLQAIAHKKPLICSDCGGPKDYITNQPLVSKLPVKMTTKRIGNVTVPWGQWKIDDLITLMQLEVGRPRYNPYGPITEFTWAHAGDRLQQILGIGHHSNFTQWRSKEITIAIPCYKNPIALDRLLESLGRIPTGIDFDVIVGNDGSDASVRNVADKYRTRLVESKTRVGTSAIRNMMVNVIETPFTVFLDCDTEITMEGWLMLWLHNHRMLTVSGASTILQFYPNGTVNSSGHDALRSSPCYKEKPTVSCQIARQVMFTQGSAMLASTHLFKTYPFWDGFTLYYDDVDWCEYTAHHGYKHYYLPVASLIHHNHSTEKLGYTLDSHADELYNSFWRRGTQPATSNLPSQRG